MDCLRQPGSGLSGSHGQRQHRGHPLPSEPRPPCVKRSLSTCTLSTISVRSLLESRALPRNVFITHTHSVACSSLPLKSKGVNSDCYACRVPPRDFRDLGDVLDFQMAHPRAPPNPPGHTEGTSSSLGLPQAVATPRAKKKHSILPWCMKHHCCDKTDF